MRLKHLAVAAATLTLLPASAALAQGASPAAARPVPQQTALTSEIRSQVIRELALQMRAQYVFPDVAERTAAALTAKLKRGGYDALTTNQAFGEALTADLQSIGKDGHLRVRFAPDFHPIPAGTKPTPEQLAEARSEAARRAYGINRTQRLPGNIGYLDIRGFLATDLAGPAISAAMTLLGGTDAIVIDLRSNGGGEPDTVAYLLTHFFAVGDERHFNDIYSRTDGSTRAYWTVPSVGARYTKPVYVLTSHDTFSGGEEFAYDMQTQKRATLIGDTTGGGANPGDFVPLPGGFMAFIPTGRAINPITKTNWEHVGVVPDVAVPAADAMRVAYVSALKDVMATLTDERDRQEFAQIIARVERKEIELPGYTPRR